MVEMLPIRCRTIYSQSKVKAIIIKLKYCQYGVDIYSRSKVSAIIIWLKYSGKLKHTIKSKDHCYMYDG